MEKYNNLSEIVKTEYDTVKILKESEKGEVILLRKKKNGERNVYRNFFGKDSVYRNLMGVSCKNLPKIIAVNEIGETTEVLEEYVFGDTLFEILKGGLLSEKEAAEIAEQVCSGLSVMHEHRAIHRDIKPENVIIRGNEAVLIDFDASREFDENKSSDTKILGTTGYASPEQYGLSQTDARSDIYSLGVMLNVMLTGEHPSTKLAEGRLGAIVQKCTMINPDSRYQTADELKKALEHAVKPHKSFALLSILAVLVLALMLVFIPSTEEEIPIEGIEIAPETTEENESFLINSPEKSEEIHTNESYVYIESLGKATGKSNLLPGDFYKYWSTDEVLTEDIELIFPGNLAEYITYEFTDDVLNIIIGNIPSEEWKSAYENGNSFDYNVMAVISTSAPDEKIDRIATLNGNGPSYNILRRQHSDGIEFEYVDFDPETERNYIGYIFAEIISDGEKFLAAPFQRESIFYITTLWLEPDGTEHWNILPYRFVLGENCEAVFFESEKALPPIEELTESDLWVNEFWQPIKDPNRVVFKTVNPEWQSRSAEFMQENGVLLEIFEKPGYIRAEITDSAADNMEILANSEFFILPPDAPTRNPDENFEEWLNRVYAETKFVGYKSNSSGISKYYDANLAKDQWNIVNTGDFYEITNRNNVCLALLPTNSAKSATKQMWYVGENESYSLMLINWYTENPIENPDAKPAICEYVYNRWEPVIIIK